MTINQPIKSLVSQVIRGVLQAAQPNRLFAAGEQGVWYDPSDFSTLFQDSAGTTPVTAVGQPVGLMMDKSGRGNHASQATADKRPVLEMDANGRYYLKGDATAGRAMVTPTITPGIDKAQVFAGIRKLSDVLGLVAEMSPSRASNNGALSLFAAGNMPTSQDRYLFASKGTSDVLVTTQSTLFNAPITNVLTGLGDISGDSAILRVNGTQAAQSTGNQGTGNYLAYPLYLFGRGGTSSYFTGHLYGLIVRFGPNLNAVTIMDIERYMAEKTGIMF